MGVTPLIAAVCSIMMILNDVAMAATMARWPMYLTTAFCSAWPFLVLGTFDGRMTGPLRNYDTLLRHSMVMTVTCVSTLIHIYSARLHVARRQPAALHGYLSLFTFAMLMLVTADNLLQLFFGWEGVGVVSYLLIGFWFKKPTANAAAIKAFVVNRVGDFGFLLGIFGVFFLFDAVELRRDLPGCARPKPMPPCISSALDTTGTRMTIICLLLFMSAPWASRRSCSCTPGCRTPWKARPRCRRSFMPRPW